MDLQSPHFLTYVLIGSVALAVLAVVLYYFPGGKIKIPAIAVTGLTCLISGAGIGVLALYLFGYHWEPGRGDGLAPAGSRGSQGQGGGGAGPGGSGGRGGVGGGGPSPGGTRRSGGPRGGATTDRGPTSKSQLAAFVAKLDVLTRKPLTVKLTTDQKAKVREQLEGLEDKEELSEEDAKKTLNALLEIVKENKETLEAAGYRWPGQGGTPPPSDIPNPFKEKGDGDHLKSLRGQLRDGKNE